MAPKKQVSPAIRILRGERDASARATHLEAATGKFLVTTNERKQMSTKTNFKRIALVAVAALGMGVLSSVPAAQAASTVTTTVANGTAGQNGARTDSSTAAIITLTGLLGAGDSVTVSVIAKSQPLGSTVSPVFYNLDSSTPTNTNAYIVDSQTALAVRATGGPFAVATINTAARTDTVAATTTALGVGGVRFSAAADSMITHKIGLVLDSVTAASFGSTSATVGRVPGTYTFTVVTKTFENGNNLLGMPTRTVLTDVDIVIAATTAQSTTVSPSLTTAFLGTASSANAADAAISAVATASSTPVGYITVNTMNANSVAVVESITVTITGAGSLFHGSTGGTSLTIAGSGTENIQVRPDGRAGTAVITVSTPTRTFAAKNVTFYSKAAKTISASVFNPTLTLGANSTAIAATAVDSTGGNWSGAMYIVASAAADALVGGSATTPVACTYELVADTKTHFCPVSTIATGTAKFKLIDAATVALATATSNEVTVTVANNPVTSIKLAFNKATYAAGEKAYITVTALDAAGKTLQGQTHSSLLASGGITTSYAFGNGSDTLTMTSIATSVSNSATTPSTAGAKTYTVYMPTTGVVKITATGGASVALSGQVEVSATATVTDSASAALAAVTALATTVASLKTLITTLTNLVLKIQKKVKA